MRRLIALSVVCMVPIGVAHAKLTPPRATVAFKHELADRYGARWTHARPAWVRCPRQEILGMGVGGSGPKTALCMAQFKRHGRWHFASGGVNARRNADISFTRSWKRQWRRAGRKCLHMTRLTGRLWSNTGGCEALMAADIAYWLQSGRPVRRVVQHGTDLLGFEHIAVYRCHRRGAGVQCVNRMGDALRYAP